jgi:hypothetical protein
VPKGFDFSTTEILDWELEAIQRALWRQEIDIDDHAIQRATERGIAAVQLLEAIVFGIAISKDLPGNVLGRVAGVNFEHQLDEGRWIRIKVAFFDNYFIVTVHPV